MMGASSVYWVTEQRVYPPGPMLAIQPSIGYVWQLTASVMKMLVDTMI